MGRFGDFALILKVVLEKLDHPLYETLLLKGLERGVLLWSDLEHTGQTGGAVSATVRWTNFP